MNAADRVRGSTGRMPALFVGHGSPMNAIEANQFRRGWSEVAARFPRPRGVLCVSAHWETRGVFVTSAERPETIHDFYGFPRELFAVRYPAPGDPALARATAGLVTQVSIGLDGGRGLDHGSWSVLTAMYPKADIPVVQLSLDTSRPASFHYGLAKELAPLREQGVLILGSGNMVHNLRLIDFHRQDGYDWAVRINDELKRWIRSGDHAALVDYPALGPDASRAVPSSEHYLPLLYALALQGEGEEVAFFNDALTAGSISMTSIMMRLPGEAPRR